MYKLYDLLVPRFSGDVSIVPVNKGLNQEECNCLVDILHFAIVFLAKTGLDHTQEGLIEMLTNIKIQLYNFFFNTDLEELGFESLEPPMVGSRLFDQRDTEVQLIKIVQNLIDSGDDFASMFLEGVMNMLVCCVSDQIGIHEGEHVDNLIVGLKDAKIAHDWLVLYIWLFSHPYSTKSFTPCASISLLIDFQVVKRSFLKSKKYIDFNFPNVF